MDLSNISVNTQSSIRIAGSSVLYFDPFQRKEEAHDADVIFVTHDHYDHFDPESIAKIQKEGTVLIAPGSIRETVLKGSGIPADRCRFIAPGDEISQGEISVRGVPAYNKLRPFHQKSKKWLGYLVSMDGITYYVSGDTDAVRELEDIRCDVALVAVGGHYTMDKKQAAELVLKIGPRAAIPTHYGSIVGSPGDGDDFRDLTAKGNAQIQTELKM